jgi:hypothetical protein
MNDLLSYVNGHLRPMDRKSPSKVTVIFQEFNREGSSEAVP